MAADPVTAVQPASAVAAIKLQGDRPTVAVQTSGFASCAASYARARPGNSRSFGVRRDQVRRALSGTTRASCSVIGLRFEVAAPMGLRPIECPIPGFERRSFEIHARSQVAMLAPKRAEPITYPKGLKPAGA